jgi:hypothetical protein
LTVSFTDSSDDPAVLLLGVNLKQLIMAIQSKFGTSVYGSMVHTSQEVETNSLHPMDELDVVYSEPTASRK